MPATKAATRAATKAATKAATRAAATRAPDMGRLTGTRVFSYTVSIVFNLVLLVYLYQLQLGRCGCAEADGWMPTFLRYAIGFSIALIPLTLYMRDRPEFVKRAWSQGWLQPFGVGVLVVGVVKAYAMLNYALDLQKCECTTDWRRLLMLYEGVVSTLMYFGIFVLAGYVAVVKSRGRS